MELNDQQQGDNSISFVTKIFNNLVAWMEPLPPFLSSHRFSNLSNTSGCPNHIRANFNDPKLLRNCSETALKLLRNCYKVTLKLPWSCSEIAMKLLWKCTENSSDTRRCLKRLNRRGTETKGRAVDYLQSFVTQPEMNLHWKTQRASEPA